MSKLFQVVVKESAVEIIKESMEVAMRKIKKDGEEVTVPCVIFATNRGKGTGAQVIQVEEFNEYLDTLQHFVQEGFAEAQRPDEYKSAAQVAKETMSLKRPTDNDNKPIEGSEPSVVEYRVREGKGAKPARIALDEFPKVVNLLREVQPMIPDLANQVRAKFAEDEAAGKLAEVPNADADDDAAPATEVKPVVAPTEGDSGNE